MHINGGSDESTESPGGLGLERGPGWMQQPVRYGDLVLSGETISTRVPDTGLAPVDNWPAACSLIEQDEVGSLLPGAKVNLVAKDVEVISTSRDDVLIPDSQCQVDTHQPGGRQNYPDIIWIDVVAWGAPPAVSDRMARVTKASTEDLGNTLGPEQCDRLGGANGD